jgi:enoyl-CoA hydratase
MIRTERAGSIAVVRIEGPKASSMSPALLDALDGAIGALAASDARAAVVIGKGRAFSAGLALPELIELDRPAMRAFMTRFETTMLRVLECPVPLVAAVNGFAIAGGCVLALMCDARLMAGGEATIGLSEIRIGIGLPASVVEVLRMRVPHATMVAMALGGGLYPPAEALRMGIVDDVVSPDELERRAIDRAGEIACDAPAARAQIKAALVRPAVEAIARTREAELERWLDTWFSDRGQAHLRDAVARLRK